MKRSTTTRKSRNSSPSSRGADLWQWAEEYSARESSRTIAHFHEEPTARPGLLSSLRQTLKTAFGNAEEEVPVVPPAVTANAADDPF